MGIKIKYMENYKFFALLFFILIFLLIPIISNADTGFSSYIVAPSVSVDTPSKTKKEPIKVTIKASNSTIKSYEILKGNKRIDSGTPNVAKKVITIPIKNLPAKGKTANYIIKATASNKENITKLVKITNKNGKYYVVTTAPSISDAQLKNNKIVITAKGSKLNRIVVVDSNTNKNVYAINNVSVTSKEISLDKNKIKKNGKDSYYRLTVYAYNQNGTYIIKQLEFILPEAKVVINNPDDTNSEPTITDVSCKHSKIKYTKTKNYHTKICAKCGANLGKEYHIFGRDDTKNTYEASGKCKICNYECKHSSTKYIKYENTHQKICNICGKEWKEEEHKISNKKCTVCKVTSSDKLTKVGYNESPDIVFSAEDNKLSDVIITINSSDKVKEVNLYEVDAKGKNAKQVKITKVKGSRNNVQKYVISNKNLLKGEKHHFYIIAKNKYGTTKKYYSIYKQTKKVNNKNVEYYAINASPKINYINIAVNKKLILKLRDANRIEYIKVYDMNDNNKIKTTKQGFTSTQIFKEIDLSKYKEKNGTYEIKVETKDMSNNKKVTTQIMKIKLTSTNLYIPEEHVEQSSGNTGVDTGRATGKNTGENVGGNTIETSNECKHEFKHNDEDDFAPGVCSKCGAMCQCNPTLYKYIKTDLCHYKTTKCRDCGRLFYGSHTEKHTFVYDGNGIRRCTVCGVEIPVV